MYQSVWIQCFIYLIPRDLTPALPSSKKLIKTKLRSIEPKTSRKKHFLWSSLLWRFVYGYIFFFNSIVLFFKGLQVFLFHT